MNSLSPNEDNSNGVGKDRSDAVELPHGEPSNEDQLQI